MFVNMKNVILLQLVFVLRDDAEMWKQCGGLQPALKNTHYYQSSYTKLVCDNLKVQQTEPFGNIFLQCSVYLQCF